MASQGSVAPKERVNIVYRPATDNAQEDVELPLKLLVLGDYTLRDDDTPVEDLTPVGIDKDNFDDVLAAQAPALSLQVPDLLGGRRGEQLCVQLHPRRLSDFTPDALVEQVPQLRALLQLREALKALKGRLSNIPAFRQHLQRLVAQPQQRDELAQELRALRSGDEQGPTAPTPCPPEQP